MTVIHEPTGAATESGYPRRWAALFVILTAEVMDLLDALIALIAGPSVLRDLGGSASLIQWYTAAYTLAMASGLLVGGRLGDIYGRRRVFLIGMAGFVAFSVLCASAHSSELLVAARVLQGLFGAVMLPQGLGLIREMFPPAEQGTAYGAFGPVMGLSSVAGPVLAGWLIDRDFFGIGWRMVFAINVPLGLLGLAAGLAILPRSVPRHGLRLDVPGAVLATGGMVCLVYPLIQGREQGWLLWCFGQLALAVVLFGCFAALERARSARGLATLVEPSLFTKRAFVAGLASGLAFFGSLTGVGIALTLFVQVGLGYSPFASGLIGLPQALGMVVGFGIGFVLVGRLGRHLMHLGIAVILIALAGLAWTFAGWTAEASTWLLVPWLAVLGIGMAQIMAPFFDIVLAGVDDAESGSASGTLTAVQQVGSSLGAAVLGTVFLGRLDGLHRPPAVGDYAHAAYVASLAVAAFVVVAGVLFTLLPMRARPHDA